MLTPLRSWWRAWWRRSQFEREMDEEWRFHLESRIDDLVRSGLAREQAVRQARLEFGNPEAWQDRARESRRLHLTDDLRLDLRFAWRGLRRAPAFAAAVIVTLALGIGATTAIVSVVNGVLLRPLPFPAPDRLVLVSGQDPQGRTPTLFGPDFEEARDGCRLCSGMAAYVTTWPANLSGGAEPDRVRTGRVTANLFSTLGIQPMLGRTFLPTETGRSLFGSSVEATPATAVVLGYGLWQRRFGSDPGVIGRTVRVEGDVCTVVGVMPRGFDYPGNAEAWVPVPINAKRDNAYLRVVARLNPGVTVDEARLAFEASAKAVDAGAPDRRRLTAFAVTPLQDVLVGDVRPALMVFLGAVGIVLLIACANVASLLLARAAARPKELAIRASLGASRSRIVRQLLAESMLLSVIGGAIGLAVAFWMLRAFVAFGPADIPRLDEVAIDVPMLTFTILLSVVTGLIFGLAPALRLSQTDSSLALQESGTRTAGTVQRQRARQVLVTGEIALALVLLIGAGLLIKSFIQLRQTPLGVEPQGVLTATVTLPEASYRTVDDASRYLQQGIERLGSLPEIRAAGVVSALPLGRLGARVSGNVSVDGEPAERRGVWPRKLVAGGQYFQAAGIPLLRGRSFDDRDRADAPPVVIVSDGLARRLWPGQDPLGRRVNVGFRGETWRAVIGVVGDVKQDEPGEPQGPAIYMPYGQVKEPIRWLMAEMTFVVRASGAAENAALPLRGALTGLDRDLPLYEISAMTDVVARSTSGPAFYALLLGSFSLLALVLAAAGIYGLIAYGVAQRTHEIGVRLALGARAGQIVRLVVGEGLLLVVAGGAIGLGGALALTRVLSRFLHDVSVTDRLTFGGISLLLALVALVACYIPARRAARIDPSGALRAE